MLKIRGLSIGAIGRMAAASMRRNPTGSLHLFLCIADHYEPFWNKAPLSLQRERVTRWITEYPKAVGPFEDSRGQHPQHTFFYPADEDQSEHTPEHIGRIATLCHAGWGDVEVHLHHENDTSSNLRDNLERFKDFLHYTHGLLAKNEEGRVTYGFVHGDWALCNSHPHGKYCGVNDELNVLLETGCYADFTMPAAPSPTQTSMVNSIYYAVDRPNRPKSHDRGTRARVGKTPPKDHLLMIQGPTMLDWSRRRYGILPSVENSDLHASFTPTNARLNLWKRAGVIVAGRPEWIFVKLHTHGAKEDNAAMLLGEPMRRFHASLAQAARQNPEFHYYYVTARQMADLVHQAESGAITPRFDQPLNDQQRWNGNERTTTATPKSYLNR